MQFNINSPCYTNVGETKRNRENVRDRILLATNQFNSMFVLHFYLPQLDFRPQNSVIFFLVVKITNCDFCVCCCHVIPLLLQLLLFSKSTFLSRLNHYKLTEKKWFCWNVTENHGKINIPIKWHKKLENPNERFERTDVCMGKNVININGN